MTIERGLVRTSAGYIHYRASGSGQAVFVFHINQQSSALLTELVADLGVQVRAIAPDLPSHGHSDHVSEQPSIADYAAWYVELMDALGIERAVVMGEANGAAIAIELAASFPGRVDRVVLVNCPYYPVRTNLRDRMLPMREATLPSDSTGFPAVLTMQFMLEHDAAHTPMNPTQDWMDRLNVAHMQAGRDRWQGFDALHDYDIGSGLDRVKAPALLMTAEHFPYAEHVKTIASRLADVRCVTLPGARFCATWEFHADIAKIVLEFVLKRTELTR